jgi:retron-type reverse transcriptase
MSRSIKCDQPISSTFGKYTIRFDIALSSGDIERRGRHMPKRHFNLIDKITDMDNLRLAYYKTAKGKRGTYGYLEFKEYSEINLLQIQEELKTGAYKLGPYREFTIYEPKPRNICALEFRDRLVQHAVCNIIEPIFEASFLPYSFACRNGLGTHAGIKCVQSRLRKHNFQYFLKTDFSKYFASIDRAKLHDLINRKIGCSRTLGILREIIPTSGIGIPIGSLTSQLFANVYGNEVDRLIHFKLAHRMWTRYMDDIIVLDDDKGRLLDLYKNIEHYVEENLYLKISKWQVSPTSKGINFLGYRIWKTHKLLRKNSVTKAKRKIRRFVRQDKKIELRKFISAWGGHIKWANSHNLVKWVEDNSGVLIRIVK